MNARILWAFSAAYRVQKKLEYLEAADEGLRSDGSMVYEHWKDSDKYDLQRQWWVQCENIIGHIDLYQYFHTEESLETAILCWNYVAKHLLDGKNGEWHWAVWNLLSANINTTFVIESNVWRFLSSGIFL